MSHVITFKLLKRCAHQAGLSSAVCARSFRVTGITEYLRNSDNLKVGVRIADHEAFQPRTWE